MTSMHQVFNEAADRVELGWTRKQLENYDTGAVCPIAALRLAYSGSHFTVLPEEYVGALAKALWVYPSFRVLFYRYLRTFGAKFDVLDVIADWNDVPWRRKRTVVRVLRRVARDNPPNTVMKKFGIMQFDKSRLTGR